MSEELNPQQRALYEALSDKEPTIAKMYLGAVFVLDQVGNPERIVHSAHSIREIIEKIPKHIEVPVKALKEGITVKVREFRDFSTLRLEKSKCNNGGDWGGAIDDPLRQVIKKQTQFFEWFDEHHPKRKEETKTVLRKLDGSPFALPETLEDKNVEIWHEIKDFFIAVCHHRRDITQEEFDKWLNAFERFLLDCLRPRTFEDFDAIDKIIAKGEKNG